MPEPSLARCEYGELYELQGGIRAIADKRGVRGPFSLSSSVAHLFPSKLLKTAEPF
jgi:hypothetical protein